MAVTLKGQSAIYEGTSEDMKPSDVAKNAIFQELDTGIDYYYNGTAWNEIPRSGGGGGTGTDNYNELNNKPSINGTVLSGNKSLDNLGIQAKLTFDNAPTSGSSNPVKSGGVYSALGGKQDAISDLQSIRNGAAAGATAVQPQAMAQALAAKQDTLNPDQLAAVNSGITAEIVAADTAALIELVDSGAKNKFLYGDLIGITSNFSDKPLSLPAGEYKIMFDSTASSGVFAIRLKDSEDNSIFYITANNTATTKIYDVAITTDATKTTIYSSVPNNFTNFMICTKAEWDISRSYQPYALSNVDLTEKEQVNKTNILSVQTQANWNTNNGVKNLLHVNSLTWIRTTGAAYTDYIDMNLPAGEYTLAYTLTTSANSATEIIYDGSAHAMYDSRAPYTNALITHSFTATQGVTRLRFYFNQNATITDMMLVPKSLYDADPSYQPYAMSNAELTAAIQALQAQLANQ